MLVTSTLIFVLFRVVTSENTYCNYNRDENYIHCGNVRCETHIPPNADLEKEGLDVKLPRGCDQWIQASLDPFRQTFLAMRYPFIRFGFKSDTLYWYRVGPVQIRFDTSWMNLYRRRAVGNGYWDFYTKIPERNCVGGFGLHAGENIAGSVTVKDKKCFHNLVNQIETKESSKKIDVYQCRKCLFHSCWLGWRVLPHHRDYLTTLTSY